MYRFISVITEIPHIVHCWRRETKGYFGWFNAMWLVWSPRGAKNVSDFFFVRTATRTPSLIHVKTYEQMDHNVLKRLPPSHMQSPTLDYS